MANSSVLDAQIGARRKIIYHEEDTRRFIETRQDTTHIIEAAKILADEPPGKDFRLAAFIPQTVLDQAFNEGWFHDQRKWKAWANDPENREYRVWGGRL